MTGRVKRADMTDNIELAVQQLISKVEASQPRIDDLESQLRELQKLFDYKEAELQRVSAEKDLLETSKAETDRQVAELNVALKKIEELLQIKDSEAKAALDASESSLLHLQQVQEELEYYFLLNQKQSKMLESFDSLSLRVAALVSKLSIES